MNSNFSFNYNKNNNEEDLVNVEYINEEANLEETNYDYNKLPIDNKRKYRILGILLVGFIFLIILFLVFVLSSKYADDRNLINEEDHENENVVVNTNTLKATINYKKDNIDYSYIFDIKKEDEKVYIVKTHMELSNSYYYDNEFNNYYEVIDNNSKLVRKEEVFDIIDDKYINEEYIKLLISKGEDNSLSRENKEYSIKIKDFLLNNETEDLIYINYSNNNYDIDYTNIMKQYSNYDSYKVNISISN